LSDESEMEEDPVPCKPDSWANLNLPVPNVRKAEKPLETFLVAHKVTSKPCLETGTWDPTKNLTFPTNDPISPRGIEVNPFPPPPPAAENHVNSAPSPASRKIVTQSHSTISRTIGTRRRLKGSKSEAFELSGLDHSRSVSNGSRRKLKKESTNDSDPPIHRSTSSNSVSMRRMVKSASKGSMKVGDPLGSSSSHSIGTRRRLRKEAENDRKAVTSAMEKVLGGSLNALEDVDDNNGPSIQSFEPPQRSKSDASNNCLGSSNNVDNDDDGFGLLDFVFKE
jgi:hypothetical protein